jgi:phosphoglycolate phosphatase
MTSAYRAHAIPMPDRETMLSIVGLSLVEGFTALGKGAADYPAESLAEGYRDAFHKLRDGGAAVEPLYPGAAEVIVSLAARDDVALGIATGKSQRGVRMVLGHHGLIEHFVTIKTADDAPSKPDPGMVLHAMREVGATPEHTVVVGDTVYDIKMAHAAGASAIGVAWGYHSRDALRDAGATVIDSFDMLVPTLDKLWTP